MGYWLMAPQSVGGKLMVDGPWLMAILSVTSMWLAGYLFTGIVGF